MTTGKKQMMTVLDRSLVGIGVLLLVLLLGLQLAHAG